MRFHLIDRVERWEAGRSLRARKLTSRAEPFWLDDGRMPEGLIVEALCQAGTWLVLLTTERRLRAALLSIAELELRGAVYAGDVLEIDVEVEAMSEETAVVSGRVTVEGRSVLEARDVMCALLDASQLEDLDATHRMERLLTREAA